MLEYQHFKLTRILTFQLNFFQLFVYLFAPIASHLKESDFQNFRLENGLKLWQGMWEYRAPQVPCFVTPVKPRPRNYVQEQRNLHPGAEAFYGTIKNVFNLNWH